MKLVCSRTRHDGNLPARCSSEFGSVRRGLDSELLHGVNRNQTVRSAERAEGTYRSTQPVATCLCDAHADSNVGADSVHHPVISGSALTVHAELAVVRTVGRGRHDTRSQADQGLKTAP